MRMMYKPYYSERAMRELLRNALIEKLVEYILLPRKENKK